jgi:hypothetical protein
MQDWQDVRDKHYMVETIDRRGDLRTGVNNTRGAYRSSVGFTESSNTHLVESYGMNCID